jgi:hypothetical protein
MPNTPANEAIVRIGMRSKEGFTRFATWKIVQADVGTSNHAKSGKNSETSIARYFAL